MLKSINSFQVNHCACFTAVLCFNCPLDLEDLFGLNYSYSGLNDINVLCNNALRIIA